MTIWGWLLVGAGGTVWSLVGLMVFVLWTLNDDDGVSCKWGDNLPLMVVICGPAIWVIVGWIGWGYWRRHRLL